MRVQAAECSLLVQINFHCKTPSPAIYKLCMADSFCGRISELGSCDRVFLLPMPSQKSVPTPEIGRVHVSEPVRQ